ncbi:MAG: hypothetical protein AAF658_19565, partial [Myxococcota bacterium]
TTPFTEQAPGTGPEFDAVLRDAEAGVCARVISAPGRVSIEVNGEDTVLEWDADDTVAGSTVGTGPRTLTCPDGRVYDVDGAELSACNTSIPRASWASVGDAFAYFLGAAPESTNVFNCADAP